MVTFVLTIEHGPGDRLANLLHELKSASTGARSGGTWNRKIRSLLKAAGVLVDPHVRWSRRGGWHPHLHLSIACLTDDRNAVREGAELFLERFLSLLARAGFHADREQQFAIILEGRANAYPAHHHRRAQVHGNLAEEMDDDTSLSPFDLAELAAAGDAEMEQLFKEFAEAMRGSKSGIVTASMAKALGIEADRDPGPRFDETTRLGTIPSPVWARLIDLNLTGTFLNQVESFGFADWPRSKWWALQQTGFAQRLIPALASEMMVVTKAIALLASDEARAIGRDVLSGKLAHWNAEHDKLLVAVALTYAEAHASLTTEGDREAEGLAATIETWAGKAAIRQRWQASHTTLPVGGSRQREAVPVG